jgi:hypothetical protein
MALIYPTLAGKSSSAGASKDDSLTLARGAVKHWVNKSVARGALSPAGIVMGTPRLPTSPFMPCWRISRSTVCLETG